MKNAPVLLDHRGNVLPPSMAVGSSDSAHYAASYSARELRGWNPLLTDADSDLLNEIPVIVSRAIDLDRNSGMASGIRQTINDNVVGTGLKLAPKPNYRVLGQAPEWASEWSKNTKAHWFDYSESKAVDADGELNFALMTQLVYNSVFLYGSALIIPMWKSRPGIKYKTCFKVIDPSRLCNPDHKPDTSLLKGGIERNEKGAIVAYWIRNQVSTTLYTWDSIPSWTRVPAYTRFGRKRVIHLYKKERPGQTLGKSATTSVLASFALQAKYQLTELQAALVNSKIAGFLESTLDPIEAVELLGGTIGDYIDARGSWKGTMESGAITNLPVGTTFKSHVPQRPSTGYADFMERISREIGVGHGISYESAMRDFSKTNYSSARAALLEDDRRFSVDRSWLDTQWCDDAYTLWAEEASDKGLIDCPDFYSHKRAFTRADWLAKGHQPLDPVKDQKAKTEGLANGTLSLTGILEKDGIDIEDHLDRLQHENRMLEERGLSHLIPGFVATTGITEEDTADGNAESEETKRAMDGYGVGVRAGSITPQPDDEKHFRQRAGLPAMSSDVAEAWNKDGKVRRPITLQSGEAFEAAQDDITDEEPDEPELEETE